MQLAALRVLRIAIASLMLTVTAATGTAQAESSQTCSRQACLYRIDKLTAYPTDGMASIPLARRIKLDRGKYYWGVQIFPPKDCTVKNIDLVGGEYSWRALIDPRDGYYVVSSVIENVAGGTPQRHACSVTLYPENHMDSATWGSWLTR